MRMFEAWFAGDFAIPRSPPDQYRLFECGIGPNTTETPGCACNASKVRKDSVRVLPVACPDRKAVEITRS